MYIDTPYKNSPDYRAVMSANKRQLETRRPYYLAAIDYHTKEGNAGQVKFFTDGLALVEKRIKALSRSVK